MNQSTPQGNSRNKTLGYVVVVVVIIVIVGLVGYQLYNNSGVGKPQVNLTAQNIHVVYSCSLCTDYFGPTLQGGGNTLSVARGSHFSETITPKNQDCCTSHQVTSVSILTPGFTLISVSPNLPITLQPGDSISISMDIQAPNNAYTGTLDIQITSSS